MAHQEDGWPLGLQPLNVRIGLVRNHDLNGSASFNTLLTEIPNSFTDSSSSNLDSESTGSFFHDRSITLGNLIGISSILELSRRSTRRITSQSSRNKKKPKTWLFSICSKLTTDAITINRNTAPSLRHFLEAEKKAVTTFRRNNNNSNAFRPDDFSHVFPESESNTLFIDGRVAPAGQNEDGSNGYGSPLLLSCLCPHPTC